jgi:hypothetical protein
MNLSNTSDTRAEQRPLVILSPGIEMGQTPGTNFNHQYRAIQFLSLSFFYPFIFDVS